MTAPLSVARLPPRRRRRLGLVVLVVLFPLLLLLSNLVPLAAEWLWFQALGYERVFTTRLVAEAVLGVGVGGLVFAFLRSEERRVGKECRCGCAGAQYKKRQREAAREGAA